MHNAASYLIKQAIPDPAKFVRDKPFSPPQMTKHPSADDQKVLDDWKTRLKPGAQKTIDASIFARERARNGY